MFESLTLEKREGRIAQPVLSLAIHVVLIAGAVGGAGVASVDRPQSDGIIVEPWVMPVPDGATPSPQVEGDVPGAAPVCECSIAVPGRLDLGDREISEAIPGLPVSKLVGSHPARSILDPGPVGIPGVYQERDLTDSPVIVHFPQPVYPPALKAAGIEGVVQLIYVVDVVGHVEPASITVVSSDHPFMSESVESALRVARFRPGRLHGTAVRSQVRQTIRFSLMSL